MEPILKEILQNIDEESRVAFLEFAGRTGIAKKVTPTIYDVVQTAFIGGYKTAMYKSVTTMFEAVKKEIEKHLKP